MGQRSTYHRLVRDDPESKDTALKLFREFYRYFDAEGILQRGGLYYPKDLEDVKVELIQSSGESVFLVNTGMGVYQAAIGFADSSSDKGLTLRLGIEMTSAQLHRREDLEEHIKDSGFIKDPKDSEWNF